MHNNCAYALPERNVVDYDNTSCDYKTCKNVGSRSMTSHNDFTCTCSWSHVGKTCEIHVLCENSSCVHGDCEPDVLRQIHICRSRYGWGGALCDQGMIYNPMVRSWVWLTAVVHKRLGAFIFVVKYIFILDVSKYVRCLIECFHCECFKFRRINWTQRTQTGYI